MHMYAHAHAYAELCLMLYEFPGERVLVAINIPIRSDYEGRVGNNPVWCHYQSKVLTKGEARQSVRL